MKRNTSSKELWIIAIVVLLLVMAILILGDRSFKATEKATFDEFNQRQLVLAREATGGIELYFETLAGAMRSLGRIAEVQHLDETPTRRELQHKFGELEPLGVNDIGILDANGVMGYNVAAHQLEGVDFSWRRYYREAKRMTSADTYVIQFIEFKGVEVGQKGVLVAVPMFETTADENHPTPSGRFAGVVLCTLKLDTITHKFVAPIKSSERGHAFLIDDEYNVLWAPDDSLFGKNLLRESAGFPVFQQIMERMGAGDFGTAEYLYYRFDDSTGEYTTDREEKLIAYASIRLGKESWAIGVWAPKEDARRLIHSAHYTQLSLVGLIILAIIVGSSYALAVSFRLSKFLEKEVEAKTEELKESHERLLTVLDSLDAAVYVADMETHEVLFVNRYLQDIFGDVVGKPCWQAFQAGQSGPCDFCTNEKLLTADGQPSGVYGWEFQNTITGLWYELRDRAIRWADGRIVRLEIAMDVTERKRTEAALKTAHAFQQSIIDGVTEPIMVIGTDYRVKLMNRAAREFSAGGFEASAALLCHQISHQSETPCNGAEYPCPLEQVRESGRPVAVVHERCRPDGERRTVEVMASPLWGADGTFQGIIESVHDITDHKRVAEVLLSSQRHLEAIKQIGALASATLNLDEVLHRILNGTLEATGASVGMIFLEDPETGYLSWGASIGLSEAFVAAYRDQHVQPGEGLTGRIAQTGEPIYIPRDSSHDPRIARPVVEAEGLNSFIGVPIRAENEIVAVMNILTRPPDILGEEEITLTAAIGTHVGSAIRNARLFEELKRAEEALTAEKERLAVTLRSIGDGVITADIHGEIVLINKVAENLTGWAQEEAIGRPLGEVFHIVNEKTRQRCENPVGKVLKFGAIVGLANNTVLIARDGTERIIADSGAPIRDKNSEVIGVVLVFRDVTEKRMLEEELLKASKLESVAVLAGGIAHDFNNLLAAILGNVSLAKMDIHSENRENALKSLAVAENASLRARDLTRQLLTFSKGGTPVKKMASIGELIEDSAGFALSGSNVKCDFSIAEDLWPVEVDVGQMSQVIQNLVINADQAMPEGGIIGVVAENTTLRAEDHLPLDEGRYVKISIKDQGIGIPEEYRHKIFDPFFTTKQKGSGLGLSIVYSIVKNHGGHIALESTPGVGTTFHLYLPASERRVWAGEKKREEIIARGKGKVLVMDDEEAVREVAGRMLRRLGYEVEFAEDGAEAIELYNEARESGAPFEAVIVDLTVPGGMGGKEAIEKLIEIDPQVKAIVSSGYFNDPVMANFGEYGFSGVVAKPYKVEELREVLHGVA